MAKTSKRGASGFLLPSELRSLLVRANASARLDASALEEVLKSVKSSRQLHNPQWLEAACNRDGQRQKQLDARQAADLLLRLSVSSQRIIAGRGRHALDAVARHYADRAAGFLRQSGSPSSLQALLGN
eukprot:4242902-Prymnesium_polylepis.2